MQNADAYTANDPIVARPMTSYSDVMTYLHSIRISTKDKERVGRRLVEETTGKYLTEAFERVDHLAQLRKDWDGRGASPISYKVLANIRNVLMFANDSDWQHWMISPDVNATICLQSDRNRASISLGALEFSYYARIDGVRYSESHVPFTPEAFLKIMRKFG